MKPITKKIKYVEKELNHLAFILQNEALSGSYKTACVLSVAEEIVNNLENNNF
jgi:hypothetical protein